jgi:hypothetical protein
VLQLLGVTAQGLDTQGKMPDSVWLAWF